MLLASSLILWIAMSAALHRTLSKNGYAAVPIMAGAMVLGLGAAGFVQLAQALRLPKISTLSDTYYVIVPGYFLLNMALIYLGVAALALLILKLARGWPKRLLAPVFWICHLGVAGVVLPNLMMRFVMPRRYVDYADTFYWMGLTESHGAQLGFLGLICLLALALVALGQRVIQGRAS